MSFPAAVLEGVRVAIPGEIRLFQARRAFHKQQLNAAKTFKLASSAVTYADFSVFDANGESNLDLPEGETATAIVCGGTRVQFYNIEDYSLAAEITDFTDIVQCCRVRRDGKLMVITDASGAVRIVKSDNRMSLRKYKAHRGVAKRADFLLEKSVAVSAGDDFVLNVFEIAADTQSRTLQAIHTDRISSCVASPQETQMLLTASLDGCVKLWDLREADANVATFTQGAVTDAAFFHSRPCIAAASGNCVKFWDIRKTGDGRPLEERTHHLGAISALQISHDDLYTLTASGDKTAKLCSIRDKDSGPSDNSFGFEVKRSILSEERLSSCAMSVGGRHFLTGTDTGSFTLWKIDDSQIRKRHPEKERDNQLWPGSAAHFKRGRKASVKEGDHVVNVDTDRSAARFPPAIERQLQTYQYQKSIKRAVELASPEAFGVLVEELAARGALAIATRGHTEEDARKFLKYINKQLRKQSNPALYATHLLALQIFVESNYSWLRENSEEDLWAVVVETKQTLHNEVVRAGPLIELGQLADQVLKNATFQ